MRAWPVIREFADGPKVARAIVATISGELHAGLIAEKDGREMRSYSDRLILARLYLAMRAQRKLITERMIGGVKWTS